MRTIEVTDEMYESLMDISREMRSQDNRCTASPYFFQVQTDEEVPAYEDCGEVIWVYNYDSDYVLRSEEEIKDCLIDLFVEVVDEDNFHLDLTDEEKLIAANERYMLMDSYDIDEYLDRHGYSKYEVRNEHRYENVFFTEKACNHHIKINGHNLKNPHSYVNYAYRNPEMELIVKFLSGLSK